MFISAIDCVRIVAIDENKGRKKEKNGRFTPRPAQSRQNGAESLIDVEFEGDHDG